MTKKKDDDQGEEVTKPKKKVKAEGDETPSETEQPAEVQVGEDAMPDFPDSDEQTRKALVAALQGPKVKVAGRLGDAVKRLLEVKKITNQIVGRMAVSGFSIGDIFSVLTMIGAFVIEHKGDLEAIWAAILELFPNHTQPPQG